MMIRMNAKLVRAAVQEETRYYFVKSSMLDNSLGYSISPDKFANTLKEFMEKQDLYLSKISLVTYSRFEEPDISTVLLINNKDHSIVGLKVSQI